MSIQEQLKTLLIETIKDTIVKKVDKDNFLDIHLPSVHPKKGTHLFFNTAKGEIKLGFYCRDKEFIENAVKKSDEVEEYSQGLRLAGNPSFLDVEIAIKEALRLISAITGDETNINEGVLSDKKRKQVKYQLSFLDIQKFKESEKVVKVKVAPGSGIYEAVRAGDDDVTLECVMAWNTGSFEYEIPSQNLIELLTKKAFDNINSEDLAEFEFELISVENGTLEFKKVNDIDIENEDEIIESLKDTIYKINVEEVDEYHEDKYDLIQEQLNNLYSAGDIYDSDYNFEGLFSLEFDDEELGRYFIDCHYWGRLNSNQKQLLKDGRFQEAVNVLEEYLKWVDDPKEIANANYAIGEALEELGQKDEAFIRYSTAIKFDPTHVDAYYSAAFLKFNEEVNAIEILTNGIDVFTNADNTPERIFKLYQLRGQLFANLDRPEEAESDLLTGNELRLEQNYSPHALSIYILGMAQYNLKKYKEAHENLKKAGDLEERFKTKQILNTRANCLRSINEDKVAIEEFKLANAADENPFSLYYIGLLLNKLSEYKEAEPYLKRLVEIEPDEKINYKPLVKCLSALSKFEEVVKHCQVAIKKGGADYYYKEIIWAYLNLDDGDSATNWVQEAEDRFYDNKIKPLWFIMGLYYHYIGNNKKADYYYACADETEQENVYYKYVYKLFNSGQPPFIGNIEDAPKTDLLAQAYIAQAKYFGSDNPYKCKDLANAVLEFQPNNLDALKLLIERNWDWWKINETYPYLKRGLKIEPSDAYLLEVWDKLSTYASKQNEAIYNDVLMEIAVSSFTTKDNIFVLLQNDLRWVRKNTASNTKISLSEIEQEISTPDRYLLEGFLDNPNCSVEQKSAIIEQLSDENKYPREFDEYLIGYDDRLGVKEIVGGTIDFEVIKEIIEDEGDLWDEIDWYDYDDLFHEYGTTELPNKILMPDEQIIDIQLQTNLDSNASTYNLENHVPKQGSGFIHITKSSEISRDAWSNWKKYAISLEYEPLRIDRITPTYSDLKNIEGLSYESLEGLMDFEIIESIQTDGKGLDHQLYFYHNGDYVELDIYDLEELQEEDNFIIDTLIALVTNNKKDTSNLSRLTIECYGNGAEFCQGYISGIQYQNWQSIKSSSNSVSWNDFCTDELILDGYWELNSVSHFTALNSDYCNIKILLDDEVFFDGSISDLRDKINTDDILENNSLNLSKDYGNSEEQAKVKNYQDWLAKRSAGLHNEDQVLVTIQTNEFFNVKQSLELKSNFDLKKIGMINLCTDEMGFGIDFGDYLIGFVYDDQPIHFEFPGGTGSYEEPKFH